MIPRKIKSDDLVGRKCKPVRNIQNGAGHGITPNTVCTIISAHYGVEIKTDPCPCCGQYTVISRIDRKDLDLID